MICGNAGAAADMMKGKLVNGNPGSGFKGASIDTRTMTEGNLFFCIRGDRFDGHRFIDNAIEKKAAGIVLSENCNTPPFQAGPSGDRFPFFIKVDDTLAALQEFAQKARKNSSVRVVAVTGTNGKSSAKEMIASVLEEKFKTLKNKGNLNNHIGLPLTLMELEDDHEIAVLEMGMSAEGEIRRLTEIAQPDIGLITNISPAHLEQLKTLKNVQKAKGELFQALRPKDLAIVNADDPLVVELAENLVAKKITIGIENPADIWADNIRPGKNAGFHFQLHIQGKAIEVELPFLGRCNIYNALTAFAAGSALGMQAEEMKTGLRRCRLPSQRQEFFEKDGVKFINDAYNANPQSMREAIKTLESFQTSGNKFFVMGEMLELAGLAQSEHSKIGKEIAASRIDFLVTVGEMPQLAAQSALNDGMKADHVSAFEDVESATSYLKEHVVAGDCVLVKGSRGARMERVIDNCFQEASN